MQPSFCPDLARLLRRLRWESHAAAETSLQCVPACLAHDMLFVALACNTVTCPAGVVVHVTKFFTAAEVQRALSFTLTALSISQVTNGPCLPSLLQTQRLSQAAHLASNNSFDYAKLPEALSAV